MGKISPQKFTLESFKDQTSWIGSLLSPLNSFLNDLVIQFSNNFTVEDNLFQEIKEIKFMNSNDFPLKFKTKFNSNPRGLIMIYLYDDTTSTPAAVSSAINWSYGNNEITITSMSGLTGSTKYIVRFLVIYG